MGDACGAVSLLAGQGGSLAIAGAALLGDVLGPVTSPGGISPALAEFERRWRPVVEAQAAGRRTASSFLPATGPSASCAGGSSGPPACPESIGWWPARSWAESQSKGLYFWPPIEAGQLTHYIMSSKSGWKSLYQTTASESESTVRSRQAAAWNVRLMIAAAHRRSCRRLGGTLVCRQPDKRR